VAALLSRVMTSPPVAVHCRFDELRMDASRPPGFDRARNVEIGVCMMLMLPLLPPPCLAVSSC
jgi:hypothetical protein